MSTGHSREGFPALFRTVMLYMRGSAQVRPDKLFSSKPDAVFLHTFSRAVPLTMASLHGPGA